MLQHRQKEPEGGAGMAFEIHQFSEAERLPGNDTGAIVEVAGV